ncbi:MAG: hypothetical protein KZQ64_06250 [gamma proteobacterium symbiont of Bathyaustriella thionipta]|nr:hypothetical protein [gamma proteobacterium symbiont of Bathyaustriella thionipta]
MATVESSLLKESFEMTTTSKTPWYLNNNRKIALLTGKAERDSMAGDILEMDGVKYLVLPLGMVNIKTKEWV